MAMNALAAHKLRSALTLLGVLIGVFSIIVVMTAMRVLKRTVENGTQPAGQPDLCHPALARGPVRQQFRLAEILAAQIRHPGPGTTGGGKSHAGRRRRHRRQFLARTDLDPLRQDGAHRPSCIGETPGSFPARNWDIDEGRALSEDDVDNARDVCVLGSALAKTAFPFGSAMGEEIKINGYKYAVVGVLAPKGGSLGGDQDNFAIIPITTALNRYGRWWNDLTILVQARDAASYDDCMEQVRGILRNVRKVPPGEPDDFELFSNNSLIEQFNTFTRAVRIGVTVVSSIALIAAGIGIMNIMLVSVTERTREIGIRRAIGAKKRNIMAQFIMEAIVLCEVGGVIGVVLGILGGNILAWYMKVPPAIPVDWVVLGLLICSVVGSRVWNLPGLQGGEPRPD